MNKLLASLYIAFIGLLFYYISLPAPGFPEPPLDSVQSTEPGDTEEIFRRAYFTDYTREEVQRHYSEQFSTGFPNFLTYKLTYSPEDAFSIIRDQTRSTHLVEFVHPLRESFFVNEFVAQSEKDTILIDGKVWAQKLTVRYVTSSLVSRLVVSILIAIIVPLTYLSLAQTFKRLIALIR